MRLTTLFAHDRTAGSYVRSLIFIDPAGLTFAVGADGRHEADMSLLLLAIGDNGRPVAQARLHVPLRLDDEAYAVMRQRGHRSTAPGCGINEAGGYQIRAAVQDDRSKAIGTSAQFVDVPKVGEDHIALLGRGDDGRRGGWTAAPGEAPATAMRTDVIADGVLGEPAIKIFKPGSEVAYTFEIYDGRRKRTDGFSTRATLNPRRQADLHHAAGARRRRAEGGPTGWRRPGRRHAVARPRPAARHLHAAGQRRAAVGQGRRSAGVAVDRIRVR